MNDQKSFEERYCEAIRDWAAAHPRVMWLDIANSIDEAPNAEAVAAFLADPEQRTRTAD